MSQVRAEDIGYLSRARRRGGVRPGEEKEETVSFAGRVLVVAFLTVSLFGAGVQPAAAASSQVGSTSLVAGRITGIDKVVRVNGQVRTYLNAQGTSRLALLNLSADGLARTLRDSDVPFFVGAGIAPTVIRWSGLSNLSSQAILRAFQQSCRRGVMVVQGYLWGPVVVRGTPIGIGYLLVAPRDDGKRW